MTKFTHPDDAPEGHKWTYEGHPVLNIYEGSEDMLVVFRYGEDPCTVWINGKGKTSLGLMVIDAPRKGTLWFNVYRDSLGYVTSKGCQTREQADRSASPKRVACFEHTFFEGEGL